MKNITFVNKYDPQRMLIQKKCLYLQRYRMITLHI